jgi:hypothetical protein
MAVVKRRVDNRTVADEPAVAGAQAWARVTGEMLGRPDVTARWMMGYPCLWRSGGFFAGFERATGMLVVKLGEDRSEALLARGDVRPFMPSGRPFRAWVRVPADAGAEGWTAMVDEAYTFAGVD